jgi:hypothetical protein
MKRLLNRSEEETNSVLRNLTETMGARTRFQGPSRGRVTDRIQTFPTIFTALLSNRTSISS